MEKDTLTTLIFKTLVKLGVFLVSLSFASPILKFVCQQINVESIDCHSCMYFISGIISIVIALIYAICNTCKKPNSEKPNKTKEEKAEDYQKEQETLRALREHEERMAIIKALGANYSKVEEETFKQRLDEILNELKKK